MSISRFTLKLLIVFLLALPFTNTLKAQTEETEFSTPNVVERIIEESEGNVEIDIPESIIDKLFKRPTANKKNTGQTVKRRPSLNRKQGFRVQVFNDGRNQSSLQARANARGNAIASRFPKYRGQVYTTSASPNWYTRVGNFETQAEANAAMAELKRAFPAFAGEMRVVKCQISIIK